uniref:Uncharacterized protein n=1 Tax=Anguilla anguilla TaxID=7936 RepID=A0A0E9X024_ANGAN
MRLSNRTPPLLHFKHNGGKSRRENCNAAEIPKPSFQTSHQRSSSLRVSLILLTYIRLNNLTGEKRLLSEGFCALSFIVFLYDIDKDQE